MIMSSDNYFDMALKMFRSMTTGLFLYPLFVALSESFDLNTHYYLPRADVINMGTVFVVLSVIFFPMANAFPVFFTKRRKPEVQPGKALLKAYILSVALSETIAVFGLIIYIVSGDIRYFYLFFVLAFIHLLMHRPKKDKWQDS